MSSNNPPTSPGSRTIVVLSVKSFDFLRITTFICATGLLGAMPALSSAASIQSVKAWHETMRHTSPPISGCFHASYPNLAWIRETCGTTHYRSNPPVGTNAHQHAKGGGPQIVGDGDDYAAGTSSLTQSATGSFPSVLGSPTETGSPTQDPGYSLQLNTELSELSPACGAYGYQSCQVWQQFLYTSNNTTAQAFIQNWLFFQTGASCPAGWTAYTSGSCYKNSGAVSAPVVAAAQLGSVKLSGSVVTGGNDTVTFTDGTSAYAVSESDSTLDVSYVWNQSEFNVVGNGGGSQAKFSNPTQIIVELQVNDGSTSAPTCLASAGTTGETNNLNLAPCSAYSGTSPYIEFYEYLGLLKPGLGAIPIEQFPDLTEYNLTWTYDPGATYHELWYANGSPSNFYEAGQYQGTSLEQGVAKGQTEYYKVQACNASGCSAASNVVFLTFR